jgi:hypothetical protein
MANDLMAELARKAHNLLNIPGPNDIWRGIDHTLFDIVKGELDDGKLTGMVRREVENICIGAAYPCVWSLNVLGYSWNDFSDVGDDSSKAYDTSLECALHALIFMIDIKRRDESEQ